MKKTILLITIFIWLTSQIYGNTPLHTASEKGDINRANTLIQAGSNTYTAKGLAPLQIALELKR